MLATVTASPSDQTRRDRVAKQFTAMAVLLLAKDGKLPLDDRVRKHIPEAPASAAAVTLRQMAAVRGALRHLGGYVVVVPGWPRGSRVHGDEHVLHPMSRQQALNFAPGTNWSYSNSGYNQAGSSSRGGAAYCSRRSPRRGSLIRCGMTDSSRDDWTSRRAAGRRLRRAPRADESGSDPKQRRPRRRPQIGHHGAPAK